MNYKFLRINLFLILILILLINGCTSKVKCNFTCCSDSSCDDNNKETRDFCIFPSIPESMCIKL